MSWFSKPQPEELYFGVRITRVFGKMPDVVYIEGNKLAGGNRRFDESITRFYRGERHQCYPREKSVEIWIDCLAKQADAEFNGNCTVEIWETDLDCFLRFHENNTKEVEELQSMEARFR